MGFIANFLKGMLEGVPQKTKPTRRAPTAEQLYYGNDAFASFRKKDDEKFLRERGFKRTIIETTPYEESHWHTENPKRTFKGIEIPIKKHHHKHRK